MMAEFYSDDKGRYLAMYKFSKDIHIGRISSKSYGDSVNLDFIPDLIKSIITSDRAEHHYSEEEGGQCYYFRKPSYIYRN